MSGSTVKTVPGFVRRHAAKAMAFLLALMTIMVGLLYGKSLSPAEAYKLYVVNVPLKGHFRVLLNVDSPEFMRMAEHPSTLFERDNGRQSRPAYIVAGYLASIAVAPVAAVFQPLMPGDIGPTQRNAEKIRAGLKTLLPVYLGYLALNVAMLLCAFGFYTAAVNPAGRSVRAARIATGVAVLLVANDVVKAFVWSPHTQMLNILVPALGTYLVLERRTQSRMALIAWSALIGIGMLAYAAVVILLPCLILAHALDLRSRGVRLATRSFAADALPSAAVCVLPTILWISIVRWVIGSYMLIETAKYGEIVWIAEYWAQGWDVLASQAAQKTFFFLSNATVQATPALLVLALSWGMLKFTNSDVMAWRQQMRAVAGPALAVSALCLGFFIFIGWPAARLSYAAVPPIIILAGTGAVHAARLLGAQDARKFEWLIGLVVVCWGAYTVLKDGPLA